MNYERLTRVLKRHEGFRSAVYECTAGRNTIGIGRNLDDVGFRPNEVNLLKGNRPERDLENFDGLEITLDEALVLLENDIAVCEDFARREFHNWQRLDNIRQEVIINMIFNLGRKGFLGFRNFVSAVKEFDFGTAAREMLDSKWAREDVPNRARELAQAMETGQF